MRRVRVCVYDAGSERAPLVIVEGQVEHFRDGSRVDRVIPALSPRRFFLLENVNRRANMDRLPTSDLCK